MTTDLVAPYAIYTVTGVGPYAVPWPYRSGTLRVGAMVAGKTQWLADGDWSVAPLNSSTGGNITLSGPAAAEHATRRLIIKRKSAAVQAWAGLIGAREKGLEAQLDLASQLQQESVSAEARSLQIVSAWDQDPIEMTTGQTLVYDGKQLVPANFATTTTPPNTFEQSAYMHPEDLALIRAGLTTGQNADRITDGLRRLHEEALARMTAANGTAVTVVYEGGPAVINRRLMSNAFNAQLWAATGRPDSRIIFTATGPVTWYLKAWQDGNSAIRTDGIYSELMPAYKVPQAVWEWSQPTGFQYLARMDLDLKIVGENNALTDPVAFRFYRVNACRTSGSLGATNLRNTVFSAESCFNSRFDAVEARAGTGWQPTEHGFPGLVNDSLRYANTGTELQIVSGTTGAPVSFWQDRHVGLRICLDRQGVAQADVDRDEVGRRGGRWFTITAVNGADRSKCTLDVAPEFAPTTSGQMRLETRRFSFAEVRATTTAASNVVTLSAPIADSLVGRTVTIVRGGNADPALDALGDALIAVVTAHTGASITLNMAAGRDFTEAPFIVSPQILIGTSGVNHQHSSWRKTDDIHFERLWCENGAFGVVPMVVQNCSWMTLSNETKLHGSPQTSNNWGGNFALIVGSLCTFRATGKFTHSLHSSYFGKFIFSGDNISVDLMGQLSAWTSDTNTSRYWFAPASGAVAFQVRERLSEGTDGFPRTDAGQVVERGSSLWANHFSGLLTELPEVRNFAPVLPPSAAALIDWATQAKTNVVALRQVLGSAYSEAQDASAIINAASAGIFSAGLRIVDKHQMNLSMQSQLQLRDAFYMDVSGGTQWRDYDDVSNSGALIGHSDFLTRDGQRATLIGWRVRMRTNTERGVILRLIYDDLTIRNFDGEYRDRQGALLGGNRGSVSNFKLKSLGATSGDGACRIIKCDQFLVTNFDFESNDDCAQFVPNGAKNGDPSVTPTSPRFGLSCTNSAYIGGRCVSHKARAFIAACGAGTAYYSSPGVLNPDYPIWKSPSQLKSLGFIGIVGKAANGFHIEGETCATAKSVDGIIISGCAIEVESPIDLDTSKGATISGAPGLPGDALHVYGTVGLVSVTDTILFGGSKKFALYIDASGARVNLKSAYLNGASNAIIMKNDGILLSIWGGRMGLSPGGDPSGDTHPIFLNNRATNCKVFLDGNVLIEEVASNKSGVFTASPTSVIIANSATISPQAGATNTRGIAGVSGSQLTINDNAMTLTVDTPTNHGSMTVTSLGAGGGGASTVAGLPLASGTVRRAFVTDATVTTFASIVIGGGTNYVPVYSDGTNWRIG